MPVTVLIRPLGAAGVQTDRQVPMHGESIDTGRLAAVAADKVPRTLAAPDGRGSVLTFQHFGLIGYYETGEFCDFELAAVLEVFRDMAADWGELRAKIATAGSDLEVLRKPTGGIR
jgi:hypothetical protein